MNYIQLITTVASIGLLIITIVVLLSYLKAKRNLKQNNKVTVKKNINGNKIAHYLFRKWEIEDIRIEQASVENAANPYACQYDLDQKALFLSEGVYKEKSITSIAIAFYEALRVKLNYQDYQMVKRQRNCNYLFYAIIVTLLVNAFKPYRFFNLGNIFIWDLIALILVFIVFFAWLAYSYVDEKKIYEAFIEQLEALPLFSKEEEALLLNSAKQYQKIILIQQKKVNGGKK
ncbi:MAG: zinc metallopeptidase [Bacilli bacterium]